MEIISRLLCPMFNSCRVTVGMVISRFLELLSFAVIINLVGLAMTFDKGVVQILPAAFNYKR